jgi:hypothetical protein
VLLVAFRAATVCFRATVFAADCPAAVARVAIFPVFLAAAVLVVADLVAAVLAVGTALPPSQGPPAFNRTVAANLARTFTPAVSVDLAH